MSKKAIKTLKNLFLPLFILSFFIVFPFHPCEAKESETDILYTVQLKKLHPEVLSSLVRGARVTDSVSKSRIGTVDSLSFTPHMTETYSSTRDRMVEVPHPYFRDASVIVRAHGTEHRHGYRLGSFELFEGATVHFFTASFTGIGECTAIYESEASS